MALASKDVADRFRLMEQLANLKCNGGDNQKTT
jgi:hypothetical protein